MNTSKRNLQLSSIVVFVLILTGCGCNRIKIIVPNGYVGEVNLIRSNVFVDQLILDSNGIGYITPNTFEELKLKPEIYDISGNDLSENSIPYNSSAFWAIGKSEAPELKLVIRSLSFEIVPDSLKNKKQYYSTDLFKLVNPSKIR
jgi:hypothetical protein